MEQLEFVLAFFIGTSYYWWWWNTIMRFKGCFWGSSSGNAVLDAVTNFIIPDKLGSTTTWSRLHVPEQASNIFRQSFSHWFLSRYYLHQPTQASSLSPSPCLSPPFLSVSSSLSSAALWLCSSAPVNPHACCLSVPPLSHSSGSSRWVAFLADSRMWNNNLLKLYIQRSIACCLPWYYAHFIHL